MRSTEPGASLAPFSACLALSFLPRLPRSFFSSTFLLLLASAGPGSPRAGGRGCGWGLRPRSCCLLPADWLLMEGRGLYFIIGKASYPLSAVAEPLCLSALGFFFFSLSFTAAVAGVHLPTFCLDLWLLISPVSSDQSPRDMQQPCLWTR